MYASSELRILLLSIGLGLLPLIISSTFDPVAGSGGNSALRSINYQNVQFNWNIRDIHAPEAWDITQGDGEVVVAVIDSGVDITHTALTDNIWSNLGEIPDNNLDDDANGYVDDVHGWDFQDNDNGTLTGTRFHHHGTFIAGIIAGEVSASGISGVAPNVKIMDLRVLNRLNVFRQSHWDELSSAVDYAVDHNADVINLSLYFVSSPPVEFHQAIQRAIANNVVVVGITGNDSAGVAYPAKYEEIIAVSAIDATHSLGSFSNTGAETEIAAPGVAITSLLPGDEYGEGDGTSFAAAHVTGVVALLRSLQSDLSISHIRAILLQSARDLGRPGRDPLFGHGLIDAKQAVEELSTSMD